MRRNRRTTRRIVLATMASLDVDAVVRDCERHAPDVVVTAVSSRRFLFRQRAVIRVDGPHEAVAAFRLRLQREAANRAGRLEGSGPIL
jgi:AmiR/NasT family two-component response regulator